MPATITKRYCMWSASFAFSSTLTLFLASHTHAQTWEKQDLGAGSASDVSADGSVVVGRAFTSIYDGGLAFRWTTALGWRTLGRLQGAMMSSATGVSANGSVVAGWSSGTPFLWTVTAGMQPLVNSGTYAHDISDDGAVVVGETAFRWTASGGTQFLTPFLPGSTTAAAIGVSSDGSVVVGDCTFPGNFKRGFRWTASQGMQDLGVLPGADSATANAVSADGLVVVGVSSASSGGFSRAFRWTAKEGLQDLGTLPGGTFSNAYGVSADGLVVVGISNTSSGGFSRAFRWTATGGMQDLGTLPGGLFSAATSVSADGNVVVGHSVTRRSSDDYSYRVVRWVGGDADGDGILDNWEIDGIPYTNPDGTLGRYILDTNGDGISDANWKRKDVFVEVDAMFGAPISASSLAEVREAFHIAPVPAPAGVTGGLPGITLHTVIDEQIPFQTIINASQLGNYRQQYFGTDDDRKPENAARLAAKAKAFRYCLFANRMTDPEVGHLLGLATDIPATTFAVSLGGLPWSSSQIERRLGSTFMHELGHALGLRHGGVDNVHYKPNYISVMNYNFDELFRWSRDAKVWLRLDFSREALDPLDEACLNERIGVSGSARYSGIIVPFAHGSPSGRVEDWLEIGKAPLNWNADAEIGTCVAENITQFTDTNPLEEDPNSDPIEQLVGFEDWSNLKYAVPPLSTVQFSFAGPADVCQLTEELVIWHRENLPPPAPPCVADLNTDGFVDDSDFPIFIVAYNLFDCAVTSMPLGCPSDFNGDASVNDDDFQVFVLAYNQVVCP